MAPNRIHEIAIIGAGPAGASLALRLAQAGLKPVIIDQAVFPRNKVCAGGLPAKVLQLLPAEAHQVIEQEINEVSLSHNFRHRFTKGFQQPLIYTVDRARLDHLLVSLATDQGAEFLSGERVEQIAWARDTFTIVTPRRKLRARMVAGADGPRSVVARSLGLQPVDYYHLGLQAEVPARGARIGALDFTRTIFLDWGSLPDGYAWIFPKRDRLALGVGVPLPAGKEAKAYFSRLLRHCGVQPGGFKLTAHLIPHRLSHRPIGAGRALLVGDAAGLADYWTGEGIGYALKSARLAAEQIIHYLRGDALALTDYQHRVDRAISPELLTSYYFSKIFNWIGRGAHGALKRYDYPWEVFCRIMRGDRTFGEIKARCRPDILLRKLLVQSARNR